jgi:hypothetical protein
LDRRGSGKRRVAGPEKRVRGVGSASSGSAEGHLEFDYEMAEATVGRGSEPSCPFHAFNNRGSSSRILNSVLKENDRIIVEDVDDITYKMGYSTYHLHGIEMDEEVLVATQGSGPVAFIVHQHERI